MDIILGLILFCMLILHVLVHNTLKSLRERLARVEKNTSPYIITPMGPPQEGEGYTISIAESKEQEWEEK